MVTKVLSRTSDKSVESETPVVSLVAPRRRRASLMLIGGLVVVTSALVAAWLVASASVTHRVLVANTDLKPGVAVEESNLRVVEVGGSVEMKTLSADDQSQVVGRFPVGVVPAGTALNPAMFVSADEVVPDGAVLVAAVLRPGSLPSGVTAGDAVSMVSTAGVEDGGQAVLLGQGLVHRVEQTADGGFWVTLQITQDLELPVSSAIAADEFRLGLVNP